MKPILAQRLRAARLAMYPNVTQREVAKRLRLSPSAINLWEAGKTEPSAGNLSEIARWFAVTTDWLLGVEQTKEKISSALPPIFTVPLVTGGAIARWKLSNPLGFLQTSTLYPPATAAAIVVSSDALASACPTGCYAVVSKGHPTDPGAIVLVSIGRASDPVIRKYIKEGRDDLLVGDDMRFPTYRLSEGAKIIGRVTEVTIRKTL